MSDRADSVYNQIELYRRKTPELLDLICAQTDEEFESAFDALLEKVVIHLEENKKHFASLDEEGLSAVFAGALSVPGLTVTQETYSNGHVDLTIEADHCVPARRKLAEAKIYNGPEYHLKGLNQLLGRYTTGREGRGLIIVYVRQKDIADLIKKLRDRMDDDLPMQQKGVTVNHILKWSFLSTHTHSCGDDCEVGHIGCNLHVQ